ncbi:uncharacterized protein LOC111372477 [Olea europaea var. sylvestris]|uniref:uncharacterized protein LOC111372477 n=1 Tax=Olea europaea var. sylvestris TaxID=158386 RepID=UPI000C1CE8C4|nr:uncharacterized protein LOC111372477 [Olea europaea var. sylvestris]
MPNYAKFVKEVISKKRKLEKYETVKLTEECSAILQKKLPQKRKDQGSFTIPCTIGDSAFDKALCDLGSSINLMPLSVFKKFCSVGHGRRLRNSTDPRQTLATGRALIDVQGGQLTLRVNEEKVRSIATRDEEDRLLNVLKEHKAALGWSIADIKGISPTICMYKILMGESYKPSIEHRRRSNPAMKEVVQTNIFWVVQCTNNILKMHDDDLCRYDKRHHGEKNLVLNWEKYHSIVQEGIILGHQVSARGLEVDRAKIDTIAKLPPPINVKGIRSFLGHARFYRRFIKDFSKIVKPLCKLLGRDTAFVFDESCLRAFEAIKEKLVTAPVMVAPDWGLPFEVMCDANDHAVGIVLGQRHEKTFQAIHYASKTLNEAQLNYTTIENKMLAVVFACDKFRSYLISTKDKKGTENVVANHLSRLEKENVTKIQETFPDEFLLAISTLTPWDMLKYDRINTTFNMGKGVN